MEPSGFETASTRLSQFAIHDNTVVMSDTCGCTMWGILLFDATWSSHWFGATILHNTIKILTPTMEGEVSEGIDANNTTGIWISGNTVKGVSAGQADAISLWGNDSSLPPSTRNLVIGNNVSGFKPDPNVGFAQIYLDPYTDHNLVACASRSDTVLDQGTANKIVGCDPSTATLKAAAHAARITSRLKLEAEPRLH